MSDREFLISNFQPVLLGDSKTARNVARRLYVEYGITSYICDKPRASLSFFHTSFAFWKTCAPSLPELLCEQLLYLASFDSECIYVLVPCTEEYRKFLSENSDKLSAAFILRETNSIFKDIPLTRNLNINFSLEGEGHVFE